LLTYILDVDTYIV